MTRAIYKITVKFSLRGLRIFRTRLVGRVHCEALGIWTHQFQFRFGGSADWNTGRGELERTSMGEGANF